MQTMNDTQVVTARTTSNDTLRTTGRNAMLTATRPSAQQAKVLDALGTLGGKPIGLNAAGAVVMSLEYLKGPEHKFPAAHDDAYAAYRWAAHNAAQIGGDSTRLALAGESAGGNLALATALRVRDSKAAPMPDGILAVYPVVGSDTTTASYVQNAQAKPLNRPMMTWFFRNYTRSPADGQDPRLDILGADLKGLPPVTIVLAEIDPLRSEGETLAAKLRSTGVTVNQRTWPGTAHEFFGQGAVVSAAKDAVQYAADGLKRGFQK